MTISERFKSRKFLLTLGACLSAIGGGLTGAIEWSHAINAIIASVVAYVAAEGTNDAIKTWKE